MRQRPSSIQRFYDGFGNHANRLLAENPGERNEDTQRRMEEFVYCPWDHTLEKATESKQTTFLRDYFNSFQEAVDACDHLDIVADLAQRTISDPGEDSVAQVLTYWSESYLNEIYIFWERYKIFITYTERFYKKDPDFGAPLKEICPELIENTKTILDPFIQIRGEHVHTVRSRHVDPELVRLRSLEIFITGFGRDDLRDNYLASIAETKEWLTKQIEHCRDTCWQILDSTCDVLAEGIITDNGWLIVPTNHKD